jgi:hypothetical protein
VDEATKAKLEEENEQRRKANETPAPDPNSATNPRSRDLTEYRILKPQGEGAGTEYDAFKVVVTKIRARNPDAAIEQAQERAPDLKKCEQLVAVPESSWHVFAPATTWKKVG